MADPKLYVLATPIGNREDITLRALKVLKAQQHFIAEDTRELRKLFALYEIPFEGKIAISHAQHNLRASIDKALSWLRSGHSIVLTSDRGTPCLSDPGTELVRAAWESGYAVESIPGASSLLSLLASVGVPGGQFLFTGFLPKTPKEREALFARWEASEAGVCFFESPHRVRDTVTALSERFPTGHLWWGRELTKQFETIGHDELSSLSNEAFPEQGEYCFYLELAPRPPSGDELDEALALRVKSDKEWCKQIGEHFQLPAREIYQRLEALKKRRQEISTTFR